MGELGGFIVIAIIVGLLWNATNESGKRASKEREVANEAIRHISLFLRERTNMGPWFEIDEFYRLHYVHIKCTTCEIDTIFVCNANASRESEFIDVHLSKGKLRIMRGQQVLFHGNPINLMSYEREAYELNKDNPPPKEASAYSAWEKFVEDKMKKEQKAERQRMIVEGKKRQEESVGTFDGLMIAGVPIVRIPVAVRKYPDFLTWWNEVGRLNPKNPQGWSSISGPGVMWSRAEMIAPCQWDALPVEEEELIKEWAQTIPLGTTYS